MEFNRKYFEDNLSDKKIFDSKMELSRRLGNNFEFESTKDFNENIKGVDISFLELSPEMKIQLNLDLDKETKISFIKLKDRKTGKVLGIYQNPFASQNESGIIEMDEFVKYLPTFLEELTNGDYFENLKNQKNLYKDVDLKSGDIISNSEEGKGFNSYSTDLNKIVLDFFIEDLDMDNKEQDSLDKQKRYDYMSRLSKAYGIVNLLEIMDTENKISELDEDDIVTKAMFENFLEYLKSLNMDNMYLDYYVRDNDLVTAVILVDEFQTKCIKLTKEFKDVFEGSKTKYPEVTGMFSSETNTQDLIDKLKDGSLNLATEYRLIKEGKAMLLNIEPEEGDEEKWESFLTDDDVLLYSSDATFTRKIYNSLKSINFIKTFSKLDEEILTNPSKILDYLPEVKIPQIVESYDI